MSNKRLSAVWEYSTQKGAKLLALLSLADRADDDGFCWPSHADTAKRARSARTYILKILPEIAADGELFIHTREGQTHQYLVVVGMEKDEIVKAMKKRFGFSDEEAEGGGVYSTDMSAEQTGGVSRADRGCQFY